MGGGWLPSPAYHVRVCLGIPSISCHFSVNRGSSQTIASATIAGVPLVKQDWSPSAWAIYGGGPACEGGCALELTSVSGGKSVGTLTVSNYYTEDLTGGTTISLPNF